MTTRSIIIAFSLAALSFACTKQDAPVPAPKITAQGFYIEDPQTGIVGEFGDLKMRIEAPGKIDHLKITERSYAVDLAHTPERRHLPLFGLERRVEVQTDITLNFRKYINTKLSEAGTYVFAIEVTDKKGQTTHQNLKLELHADAEEAKTSRLPVETGEFRMERIDKRVVAGTERFGIEWITTDEVDVTIQVRKMPGHPGSVGQLASGEYQRIQTKGDIKEVLADYEPRDFIEFDTANNAAAGRHLAIEEQGDYYFLAILSSHTSVSELGTTVTLTGEYKY